MPKFDGAPNVNNPEIIPTPERPISPEVQARIDVTPQTPGQKLGDIETKSAQNNSEIGKLAELVQGTKDGLNAVRAKLGLPPTEENPPSVFASEDKLAKLEAEQKVLAEQRAELIRQEKEKILQEKLDALFVELKALAAGEFESVLSTGKMVGGQNIISQSMGSLSPEVAKSFARALKEDVKLLSEILESNPDLLKDFDVELTREAEEKIKKAMEEEKEKGAEKVAEKPKEEEKPVPLDGGASVTEMKQETNPVEIKP
ncbi:MAG: hypothetical protein WCI76_01975 [bacterium]